MTTNDIDAIRKLTDAATPGPWHSWTVDPRPRFQVGTTTPFRPVAEVFERSESGNDAEFIAAARTLVPALCDEIEQLRAEVARWKGKAERYRYRHDAAAQALSAERAKNMRVAMVKCWTNEDGQRFVFVTDLQKAMGVPAEAGVSE